VEHMMSVEETASRHATDIVNGLTSASVATKLEQYGRNELKPPPTKPAWLIFLGHQTGFFSLLLWLAAFLCFFCIWSRF
jgi:magnesium-transporting ATPase (P-type)